MSQQRELHDVGGALKREMLDHCTLDADREPKSRGASRGEIVTRPPHTSETLPGFSHFGAIGLWRADYVAQHASAPRRAVEVCCGRAPVAIQANANAE